MDLKRVQELLAEFAQVRDWDQFHDLRSLALALTGEVGELCELLQWKREDALSDFLNSGGRERLAEEVSDVLFYLLRIADKGGIDISAAVSTKLAENQLKYPVEKSKGVATKYTDFTK